MPTSEPAIYRHPPFRPEWLDRLKEPILEPALPIIDSHHHLWELAPGYLLNDLLADLDTGHNIVGTVYMQCRYAYRPDGPDALRPVGETEFAVSVAEEAARRGSKQGICAGIVGCADLTLGDTLDDVLDAHLRHGGGRFRGIRHIVARHGEFLANLLPPPPLHLLDDPRFRDGARRLTHFGLSFDAWLYHTQIDELTAFARACPSLPIALNHLGGPLGIGPYRGRTEQMFHEWIAALDRLADCANVSVKLGGLAMVTSGFEFHKQALPPSSNMLANAWQPYIDACVERFGVERCMFESNFPVDKAMCSYPILWNAYKRMTSGASAHEKAALFHDTAARFYRLAPGAGMQSIE
jgi:L-fuconolactonase